MHIQPLFTVPERDELHRLMRAYPLALLATSQPRMEAHLLPLEIAQDGPHGRLKGHVSRTHSLWTQTAEGSQVMVVFQGPNAYISPRWYVNGQKSGRVAPSWNFVAVQAHGRIRFIDDAAWIMSHLASLTASQEAGREQPWSLAGAPPDYIAGAAQGLVGFEIDIEAIEGKRFLSQQRTQADRLSLVDNLRREESGAARDVAALIRP